MISYLVKENTLSVKDLWLKFLSLGFWNMIKIRLYHLIWYLRMSRWVVVVAITHSASGMISQPSNFCQATVFSLKGHHWNNHTSATTKRHELTAIFINIKYIIFRRRYMMYAKKGHKKCFTGQFCEILHLLTPFLQHNRLTGCRNKGKGRGKGKILVPTGPGLCWPAHLCKLWPYT